MTPKEKAKELVEKIYFSRRYKDGEDYIAEQVLIHAKQCALIAVDEILNDDWYITTNEDLRARDNYWNKVKQEIEKL